MKKILTLVLSLAFLTIVSVSCTEECKNCKTVTKDTAGNIIQEGTSSEYCDEALEAKENEEPATDGSTTTAWYCE